MVSPERPIAGSTAAGSAANGRIRVLHVASGDGWGGAERVISLLIGESLTRPGVEITCLLLNEGRLAEELRALGAEVEVFDESRLNVLQLASGIRTWLRDRRFEVHHVHRYKELAVMILALAPGWSRLAVTVHGLQPASQLRWSTRIKNWVLLFASHFVGARIVAVSTEIEGRLRRVLPRARIRRIHNPLPPRDARSGASGLRERLGWNPAARVVGFVGRLEAVKGPDRFLQVARASDSEIRFVVIGGGSMEDELRATISRCGLDSRVALVGELPDAAARIAELDLLAVTSRHEGLPMVLLEAAAASTPVIAFDVGGVAEVVDGGPAARRVTEGDVGAFAANLGAMLADPALKDHACGWGERVRKRMALAAAVDGYLDLYAEIDRDAQPHDASSSGGSEAT